MALVMNTMRGNRVLPHGMHPIRLVKWEAPKFGTFKINVDGSFYSSSGKAGVGGLIRDSNGNWIVGFSDYIHADDILYAELLAIKKGLELAWDIGCRQVICETDSTSSLQLIEYADTDVHVFGAVIKQIRRIHERKWEEIQLVHIFREGNQCADLLAKFGSKHQYSCIWNTPLPALWNQLGNDANGMLYHRSFFSRN